MVELIKGRGRERAKVKCFWKKSGFTVKVNHKLARNGNTQEFQTADKHRHLEKSEAVGGDCHQRGRKVGEKGKATE